MLTGDIVSTRSALDRGTVLETGADEVTVSHFLHPGDDGEVVRRYPLREVRRTRLLAETRAYVLIGDGLVPARVHDHFPDDRRMVVRAQGEDRWVPEASVRVRAASPIADASAFLEHRVVESRRFHASRSMFVREYLARAAGYHGLTSIASSSIDLVPHQLETARRILADPIQRYILADEVGMGKTIEAGLVVRQHLLDSSGSALIICPDALLAQWNQEMDERFLLRKDFPGRVVVARPADAPAASGSPSLIVVDEAHELLKDWDLAAWLEAASERAACVLLLTATPPLDDPEGMLRLLKVLQPGMEDEERRLTWLRDAQVQRGAIADALSFIRPTNMAATIERGLVLLLEATDDQHVRDLVAGIQRYDLRDGDAHVEPLLELASYVTETHRVLARSLRERRDGVLGRHMPVIGRQRPVLVPVSGPPDRQSAVDAYVDAIALLPTAVEPDDVEAMSLICSHINALLTVSPAVDLPRPEAGGQLAAIREAFATVLEYADPEERDARLNSVVQCALDALEQCGNVVVLTHSGAAAVRVHSALIERCRLPQRQSVRRLSPEDPSAALWFKERGDLGLDGSILVVDELGEIGQNLQRATTVIHAGLVVDPVHWEQRIGRFDRYGDDDPQEHVVVIADSTFEKEWKDLLTDGFGVFDSSRATLQSPMARLGRACLHDAVTNRPDELCDRWAKRVHEALAEELDRVEREEVLELGSTEEARGEIHRSATRAEANEQTQRWRDALLQWASGERDSSLAHLRFMLWEEEGHRVTLAASPSRPPLIALDRLAGFSAELAEGRTTGVFGRFWATRDHQSLFNPGHPFVEALVSFTRGDDRGRTFTQLRSRPARANLPDEAFFLFDFLIEADLSHAEMLDGAVSRATLRRLVDAYLPARFASIWLDAGGGRVTDPAVLALLNAPIDSDGVPGRGRRDATLRADDWYRVDEALNGEPWRDVVARVRTAAQHLVETDGAIADTVATAIEALRNSSSEQHRRLLARKEPGSAHAAASWSALSEALLQGVEAPSITVDACGLVVLSETPLGATV